MQSVKCIDFVRARLQELGIQDSSMLYEVFVRRCVVDEMCKYRLVMLLMSVHMKFCPIMRH